MYLKIALLIVLRGKGKEIISIFFCGKCQLGGGGRLWNIPLPGRSAFLSFVNPIGTNCRHNFGLEVRVGCLGGQAHITGLYEQPPHRGAVVVLTPIFSITAMLWSNL
jgi:hypothetical protein